MSADAILSNMWGHAATSDVDIVLSIHQRLDADAAPGTMPIVHSKVIPVHSVVLEGASPLWKVCSQTCDKDNQEACIDLGGSWKCGASLNVARADASCGWPA